MPDEQPPPSSAPNATAPTPVVTSAPLPTQLVTESERRLQSAVVFFGQALQEVVRSGLALLLVVLVLITLIYAFRQVGNSEAWPNTKELLDIVVPALTGLLGSAMGFYFGSRTR